MSLSVTQSCSMEMFSVSYCGTVMQQIIEMVSVSYCDIVMQQIMEMVIVSYRDTVRQSWDG